jgi:molybdopterin-containing oxidoreductase family membrane subunit
MAKLLGVFTAIDLYFFGCDLLTTGFPGAEGAEIVALLTSGPLALFFWTEVVFGVITMCIAFVPSLRRSGLIVVAAVLSVLAILCKRIQLLEGGFQVANITYPTVTTGPQLTSAGEGLANLGGSLVYVPSPLELGVVLGVIGLGVFLLLLGLRILPLKPTDAGADE